MQWRCPECGIAIDDSTIKCSCGYESTGQEQIDKQKLEEPNYKGIGGWLIFPVIGLFLGPLVAFVRLLGDLYLIGSFSVWMPYLLFDVLRNLIYIIFPTILLVLLFKKSRMFPKVVIYYFILGVILSVGEAIFVNQMPAIAARDRGLAAATAIAVMIVSAIWISYFRRSIRVKNTFVK